ncbi:MAG: hypothetical protein KDC46_00635 [Thermoleophilia bacterium]|nr:hypothetical protein [Thermoleophilia bacterium]
MRHAGAVFVGALPGIWLGLVVAISFIETPLKFRAPGITLERGLGIGRIVFHALNSVELALGAILLVALFALGTDVGSLARWAIVFACAALLVQMIALRPVLDRRLDARVAGEQVESSAHHVIYIGLEVAKAGALATATIALAAAAARASEGSA